MANVHPVLIALPLDHETPDIVATVAEFTRRAHTPIVVVHVIPVRRLESDDGLAVRKDEARRRLDPHLAPLRAAGIDIRDVVVELGDPAEVIVATALRCAAQMNRHGRRTSCDSAALGGRLCCRSRRAPVVDSSALKSTILGATTT